MNHLSKVEEGLYAYVRQALEIYRPKEQSTMTQAGKSPPLSGPQSDEEQERNWGCHREVWESGTYGDVRGQDWRDQ